MLESAKTTSHFPYFDQLSERHQPLWAKFKFLFLKVPKGGEGPPVWELFLEKKKHLF